MTIKIVSRWNAESQTIADFLLSACQIDERGCMVWQLSLTAGAGRVCIAGKKHYAHRLMYEACRGPIAPGLLVRHSCDNRACINPSHLEVGTHADNMRDMIERGRSTKGRSLSIEHRMKVAQSLRGRKHPEHVKAAIAASVRAYQSKENHS